MEQSLNSPEMLESIHSPAFFVENGVIVHANQAALKRQICVGARIADYIAVGSEEYTEFTDGKLCLVLCVCGICANATVVANGKYHVFHLESDYADPELRAFALAAQHLREPLANAMICANSLIPDDFVQESPDLQAQLSQLNKNLYQLHRAICNMSDAAQFQNPRPSRFEYQEANSIFHEVLEKAAHLLTGTDHKLEFTGLQSRVSTMLDAEKLERALLNLISNAVKFAPKGSTIHAALRKSGKKLYFTLENSCFNDAGIHLSTLYSNYLREPGIENPSNGIGLGMTIVQKAAAAHGGTLLLEQTEHAGMRFTMTIPIETVTSTKLRSKVQLPVDYAGGYDHALTELSDVLPAELYK